MAISRGSYNGPLSYMCITIKIRCTKSESFMIMLQVVAKMVCYKPRVHVLRLTENRAFKLKQ